VWTSRGAGGIFSWSVTFQPAKGGLTMATAQTTRGRNQDRSRVAGGQGYEVNYFARKHGITAQQARDLIKEIGNDRDKLNAAAARLTGGKRKK
jgi:hypothetical protein